MRKEEVQHILYAGPVSDFLSCVLALSLVMYNFRHLGGGKDEG